MHCRARASATSCRPAPSSTKTATCCASRRPPDTTDRGPMIDHSTLRNWRFASVEHRYTLDDSMRYALALGLGEDPMDPLQLQFVNDTLPGQPLALPTMAVVLGFPGSWMQDPPTGIDFSKIVHGEEEITLHEPLPAPGSV